MQRFACILILILTAFSVSGQDYETFFEEFDVVMQQIQVNVVDKDGSPVTGLTKEDFMVLLNKQKQDLESIEEIDLETMVSRADRENKPISEQARRLFVLFFDLRFSTRQGILKAREAARDFVMEDMLPTDLAGVFTYSQLKGISIVTNFTSDTNHLFQAIDTLGLESATNVLPGPAGYYTSGILDSVRDVMGFNSQGLVSAPNPTPSRRGEASNSTLAAGHVEEMLLLTARTEKRNYEREVMAFLTGMTKFGDGLRYIRGRKNMIWFSTGFDDSSLIGASASELGDNALLAMFGNHERVPANQYGSGDVQSAARRAVEAMQASGTVIFAMDTSMAEGLSKDRIGANSLNFFASDTGGRVYSNRNEFHSAFDKVKDLTNHYYLLSFYPQPGAHKDNLGKIKIQLTRSDLNAKVYAGRGILLDPEFEKMSQIEKNIQISEYIARDQVIRGIPVSANVFQVPMSNQLIKLNVGLEIRGDYFAAPGIKDRERQIEVFTMAFDQKTGSLFDQTYFQFSVDPRFENLQGIFDRTGLKYFANLFVKPGSYKLKVIARDLVNGKIGSWISNLEVEENNQSLAGPVILTDDKWVMIRQPESLERQKKTGDLDFSYPYQLGSQTFVPSSTAMVAPNTTARFFYLLDYRVSDSEQNLPSIQMMFMDAHGKYLLIPPEAIKAETELEHQAPHLTRLMVSVDMSKLHLKEGETYKLMAYFGLTGQPAIRSMSEITIAAL